MKLCRKCMAFYASIATNYMCSKCFKESGGVVASKPIVATTATSAPTKAAAAAADIEMKDESKKEE